MSFLLLTGIPRSGTTLAAALLDSMDDTVCLSEPDEHVQLMERSQDAAGFAAALHRLLVQTKRDLLQGKTVVDRRQPDGSAVTNYLTGPDAGGNRQTAYVIRAGKPKSLSPNVLVGAKHNALFIAALPELVRTEAFRIIALVRDPVAVLTSWQSVPLPIATGRLPAAERFWPELRELSADTVPLLTKQMRIYDLLCRRFIEHRHKISILKYEDMVSDCTKLADATGRPLSPERQRTWERTISKTAARPGPDSHLYDAVRAACARREVSALLGFYPRYG